MERSFCFENFSVVSVARVSWGYFFFTVFRSGLLVWNYFLVSVRRREDCCFLTVCGLFGVFCGFEEYWFFLD